MTRLVEPDTFLPNQLPKPILYHDYKIIDMNSKVCSSFCLYFFDLIERMSFYDAVLETFFVPINMPINVFRNSSINSANKIDTSVFEQKPYLRTNYLESNIKEDIDLKNQFRNKNLPDLTSVREAA